jgi:molybdopterin molybdotransferase
VHFDTVGSFSLFSAEIKLKITHKISSLTMTTTMAEAFEKKVHPMVPVPDAIRIVLRQAATAMTSGVTSSETLSTYSSWNELLGRRLAEAVLMAEPGYPAYNASIMDGYAVQSSDVFGVSEEGWTHSVVDKVFAGDTETQESAPEIPAGSLLPSAYYITTGAGIPTTCDCVVPIEQCTVSEGGAKIAIDTSTPTLEPGQWVRGVGCDMAAQSEVLPKGHVLDPVSLGLVLQSGQSTIQVQQKLRVGVLSTGNELLSGAADASTIAGGKIPDANRPILLALLSTFGSDISPVDLGIQRDDDLESLSDALRAAIDQCHVVITTGGISMGESDVLEQVLMQKLGGTLHFGRLHMKPGKPTTFITTTSSHDNRTRFVFCMPGNPVSATVCTQLIVRPCLDLLSHQDVHADVHGESVDEMVHRMEQNAWVHPERAVTLVHDMKLDKERPEYHRVILTSDGNSNMLMASSTGVQRSSRLMSLRDAQGLLVLPQGVLGKRMLAKAGDEFTVLLLKTDMQGVQVDKSQHLNKKAHHFFQIAVVHVVDPASRSDASTTTVALKKVSDKVQNALSGSKSGTVDIVSSKTFCGPAEDLFGSVASADVDVIVVVCQSSFPGSFVYQLDVASSLRKHLVKVADTMALQARRGVASENAASALLETVVGYVPTADGGGSMLILVPEEGLQGGLSNVRGLLKHALKVSRGKGGH